MFLFFFIVVSTSAFVLPTSIVLDAPKVQNLASYAYALDFSQSVSVSTLQCMKSAGYQTVFIRGYNPAGPGSFDTNAVTNINNAFAAGIGSEVYMTPQPVSGKTATVQVDEMINGLNNRNINVRAIWIQVTSPIHWGTNTASNINFINELIQRAQSRGLQVGIYTNSYDWTQITNNYAGVNRNVLLWYWNVLAGGVNGETAANFGDFRAFGSFTSATVKQFGQVESVCSTVVNRNVFMVSGARRAVMSSPGLHSAVSGPTVGVIGF